MVGVWTRVANSTSAMAAACSNPERSVERLAEPNILLTCRFGYVQAPRQFAKPLRSSGLPGARVAAQRQWGAHGTSNLPPVRCIILSTCDAMDKSPGAGCWPRLGWRPLRGCCTGCRRPPSSADVKVVNVLATVRDKKGQIVRDLTRSEFLLDEDGRPQPINTSPRKAICH